MAELQGDNITDSPGTGAPNFPFGFKNGGSGGAVIGKTMTVSASANGFVPHGVYTKVSLDTVLDGNDDGTFGFDPVNFWFIPKAGWYLINAYIKLEGNNGTILVSSTGNLGLFLNTVGATPSNGALGGSGTTGTASNVYTAVLAWPIFVNGTDKLILAATETDSSSSQAATDACALSIMALGNAP